MFVIKKFSTSGSAFTELIQTKLDITNKNDSSKESDLCFILTSKVVIQTIAPLLTVANENAER